VADDHETRWVRLVERRTKKKADDRRECRSCRFRLRDKKKKKKKKTKRKKKAVEEKRGVFGVWR
jgi:hypothetical protein